MILHSKENMTSDFDLWHMVNSDCKDYIAESRSDTTSYSVPGMPTPPLSPELQHSSSSASFYLNSSSLLSTYEASSTARTNEHSGVESYHIRRSFDHVCHNNPLDRLNGADLLANDVENNTVDHLSPPLQGGVGFEDFTDIDIMDNLSAIAQHMDYSVNEVEPTKYIVHDIMWSGTAKIASDIHNQCQTKDTSKCCLCESGCDDSSSDSDNFEAVSPRKIDPTVPPPKVKENSGSDECIANKVDSAPNRVNGFETPSDSDDDVVDIETIDENSLTRNTEKHQTVISALPTYQRYQMTKRRQRRQSEESGEVSPTIVTSTMTHVASMHNYSTTQPMVPTATHTNTTSARLASILARGHRSVELSGSESKKTKHRYAPYNKNNRRQGMESDDSLSEGSKRAQHNVLERKRRNDLKSSFDRLRQSVPELQNVDRAAKVLILKKAAEFIYSLRNVENAQSETMSRLKARRAALLSRKEALSSVQFSI